MMRGWSILIALPLVLLGTDAFAQYPTPSPPSYGEVCDSSRRVGRTVGLNCPATTPGSGWAASYLFGPLEPPPFDRYCLYTWVLPGAPTPSDVAALPNDYDGRSPVQWTDPDCLAVAPQSSCPSGSLPEATQMAEIGYPSLRAEYAQQLDQPGPSYTPAGQSWVAIFDSRPRMVSWAAGKNRHGLAMEGLIQDRACDSVAGPCPLHVEHYLALDYSYDGGLVPPRSQDLMEGGDYGYIAALAPLIRQAVKDYLSAGAHTGYKLIINLSVGWDPLFNAGDSGNPQSEASEAVKAALEEARCAGALIIAAAGNRGWGPAPSSGPVFPAAWETHPAPACVGTGYPLVYAVGGVDGADAPLLVTRDGGQPQLVAPAHEALTQISPTGGAPSTLSGITGTSVSAGVTSGTAALLWSLAPGLSADDIYDAMFSSGEALTSSAADFCLGGSCGVQSRLSVCNAVDHVLGTSLCSSAIPAYTGARTRWTSSMLADVDACMPSLKTWTATYPSAPYTSGLPCGNGIYLDTATSSPIHPYPCASEVLVTPEAGGILDPQPPPDKCPDCALNAATSMLYMPINPALTGYHYPSTLVFRDYRGNVVSSGTYDLASARDSSGTILSSGLGAGRTYRVSLSGIPLSGSYSTVTIEWVDSTYRRTVSVSDVTF